MIRNQDLNRNGIPARRSHLEIKMDILDAIREEADKPTRIMYKANLSWIALQQHLNDLAKNGLIKVIDQGTRKKYELTEKAIGIIQTYKRILEEIQTPSEAPLPRF